MSQPEQSNFAGYSTTALPEGDRMFTFRCGTRGASVTCHHCGWRVAGRWPRDVYPKAEAHVCRVGS